ncbi:MAG: ADP-forming succinate--CoA ligase subunit beta [Sulfolobales archaeon]
MRLYEYEGKRIFSEYKIPVPRGGIASSLEEVEYRVREIGLPSVLKAQVLIGGRGKAGGIRIARSLEEAREIASRMFSEGVKNVPVRKILVEEAVNIVKEYYLSITIDRSARKYVYLASAEGGVDIEEIAARKPEAIIRIYIDPVIGLRSYHLRALADKLGMDQDSSKTLQNIAEALYKIMLSYDADLVEINPLALTDKGLIALDSKITLDDNALFRHKELAESLKSDPREFTEEEVIAREYGFSYVSLDGDIGVIGNGAGLTMASLDLVAHYGGKPANFLDIGGGARAERVKAALLLLLRDPRIKVVFINVYGGITRCDEVARGIVEALKESGIKKPLSVRLVGTREEEGRKILEENGISYFTSDEDAAKYAVELASRSR